MRFRRTLDLCPFLHSVNLPEGVVDPSVDMKAPPVEQLAKMDGLTFFKRLAMLMKSNPPPPEDAPALANLAKIGVVPGQDFDAGKLDPTVAKGLQKSVSVALEKLQAAAKEAGAPVNGWRVPPMTVGKYGMTRRASDRCAGRAGRKPTCRRRLSVGVHGRRWQAAQRRAPLRATL